MMRVPKPGILRAILTPIGLVLYPLGWIGVFLQWFVHGITLQNLFAPGDTQEKAFLQNVIDKLHAMPYLPLTMVVVSVLVIAFLCVELVVSSRNARNTAEQAPSATEKEQGQSVVTLVDKTISLAQRLARDLGLYIAGLPSIEDTEDLAKCLDTFVTERWTDAKEWLALPDEQLRYSIWLAEKPSARLLFAHGDASVNRAKDYFNYGEGLAGRVFASASHEPLNEREPARLRGWKRLTNTSRFRAIVIVIVPFGDGRPLGVLNVTRMHSEKFDPIAVRAIELLGSTIGVAIGATAERRAGLLRAGQPPKALQ
ncbi:MAG: hypothetical protein QOF71_497 [Candidatus Eremiobacteraeota bacterium]|jgi:hypothetical protein|nr:hypothetical protein [Candidatus Eremiobacteraeota bacterium]